jgi:predicted nuclease of predicted toxin-antitoxin system
MGVSPKLTSFLKNKGYDVEHTYEIGLAQSSDKVILDYAVTHNQILLTTDLDFGKLVAIEGTTSPGLIIMRLENPSPETMILHIEKLLNNISDKELMETLIIVESYRIRKRKRPIIPDIL